MADAELRQRLLSGGPCLGCWITLSDPAVAEMLAEVGFDFVIVDTQHAPITIRDLQTLLIALKGSDTVPMVRVARNDFALINKALDVGAEGILVPMVDTAEQAQRAVLATRYAPMGKRSMGPWRAGRYGRSAKEYIGGANDRIILITQVESREALDNLDALIDVDGVDCLFIGPGDLGASLMGVIEYTASEVERSIDEALHKCLVAGKPMGIASGGEPESARQWLDKGAALVATIGDLALMRRAAIQFLQEIRWQSQGQW